MQALDGLKRGRTPAPEPEPVRPVPDGLVDAVQPYVSRQVWGLIQLQRYTGCRPGEAVIMRGCDLDTTGMLWLYRPAHHKTKCAGKQRVIALGPKAQAILRQFLKPDVNAYLFSPADADRERREKLHAERETPLSCGNRPGSNRRRRPQRQPGEHYSVESYGRAIAKACDKAFPAPDRLSPAELKAWQRDHRWSPNQLRHTFATRVRRDFGLEAAQVALGHSQAAVTEIYAERNQTLAAEVARKIG